MVRNIFIIESYILEDVNKCVVVLQEGDVDIFDRIVGVIRGRFFRVCNVVIAEMENYEVGVYVDRVMEVVVMFRD